jgi:ABC-2 type transport system ATP-binding protein
VADDRTENLNRIMNEDRRIYLSLAGNGDQAEELLRSIPGVVGLERLETSGDGTPAFVVEPGEGEDPREAIFYALAEHRLPLREMRGRSMSLEDIYLRITAGALSALPNSGEDEK